MTSQSLRYHASHPNFLASKILTVPWKNLNCKKVNLFRFSSVSLVRFDREKYGSSFNYRQNQILRNVDIESCLLQIYTSALSVVLGHVRFSDDLTKKVWNKINCALTTWQLREKWRQRRFMIKSLRLFLQIAKEKQARSETFPSWDKKNQKFFFLCIVNNSPAPRVLSQTVGAERQVFLFVTYSNIIFQQLSYESF